MVRNFKMVNGFCPLPTRVWRKNTGPLLVSLTTIAVPIRIGLSTVSPNRAPAMSIDRLAIRWLGPSTGGVRPSSGVPSRERTDARLPTTSNRRGTMSTCTAWSLHTRTTSRPASWSVVKARTTWSTRVALDHIAELSGRAEHGDVFELVV